MEDEEYNAAIRQEEKGKERKLDNQIGNAI